MKEFLLTNEQIGSICRALAHLIHAGIGTADALTLLQKDEQEPTLQQILAQMALLADEGKPLCALFREAACFPSYVCTLLDVGERVGKTEETLQSLADYYDGRARMNRRLKAALTYPSLLLAVLLAVVVVLLVWVLPVFDEVYAQLGSRLTGFAGGLLTFGTILRQILPVVCILLAAAGCAAAIAPLRKAVVHFWKVHMGDRGVMAQVNAARFIQALSLALSSGLTAQEAVTLASDLAQEDAPAFENRCKRCLELLDAGSALPRALLETQLLSAGDCRLLEAGIRSGRSDQVLQALAQKLLETSEEALEREAGKAEPAMIAIACVLIGSVLLSVMLPLMQIMNTIG